MKSLVLALLLLPPPVFAESFASWSAKAKKAEAAKDYDGAVEDYTNALRLWDKRDGKKARARILSARAAVYERQEDFKLAAQDLTSALVLEPGSAFFLARRGKARLALQEVSKAIDDFDKAIAAKLDYGEAYFGRAEAYEAKGDKEFSREDYKMSCKLGVKKGCHPHAAPAPVQALKKKKRPGKPVRPRYDFAQCLKLLDDCAEAGSSYDHCVDEAKTCPAPAGTPCCPAACVKDYDRALSGGLSAASAYRVVFSTDAPCAKNK